MVKHSKKRYKNCLHGAHIDEILEHKMISGVTWRLQVPTKIKLGIGN